METMMAWKRIQAWTTTLGLGTLLVGMVGVMPAKALDHYHDNDGVSRRHIQDDLEQIRYDQRRLDDLQERRDRQARCHDWRAVRDTECQIASLRTQIDRERRDVHHDVDRRRDDRADARQSYWQDRGDRWRDRR